MDIRSAGKTTNEGETNMRTTLRSRLSLLFMMCAMMLAIPAVAYADYVVDDVVAGGNDTITAGGSTTINYRILNQNTKAGDLQNSCNVSDGTKATVTLNVPADVTASKTSLTFSACDTPQAVQFSSSKAGDHSITASVSDSGVGTYDTSGASFTLHVNAAPVTNTKPALTLPANITEEATGASGAAVSYTATANDKEDGALTPDCSPKSGSTFPIGTTTVNCSATDSGNLSASGSFTVEVTPQVDRAAPVFSNVPADITEEATSSAGASVTYTGPTATDNVDGPVPVKCLPASGSTFALGTTEVTCSAEDAAGNPASASFNVTVQDKTGPVLELPADITEEATSANGAVVNFTATASDLVDGSVSVSCSPDSGTFALGTTTVNCSATDKAGNESTGSFSVKVEDTTAPTNIQFVGDFNDSFFFGDVPAAPTCTADDGGSGMKSCVVSGYSTAVGTHTLKATATDNAGNKSTKEISYTVKPYTLNGFYQPIDMNNTVNTVKNGSTVPVKFELFKGTTELTSTSAVTSIKATPISCGTLSGDPEDAIETTATGGTSLRYDATAGQFIYNWTTPKGASQVGKCYSLTMTAADSSTITAYFKLK